MPVAANVYPASRQWTGIGRELVSGTAVLPAVTVPSGTMTPDDKPTWLEDKSLRGSMAEDYGLVQGTEIAEFDLGGPVYLDTIGHILFNAMGDYVATGSTPANSTTLNGAVSAGATSVVVVSGTGYAIGQNVQIGITADGNPENVILTNVAGTTLTFTGTPLRFAHLTGKTVATVVAPFTHIFSLLNSGNGQPPAHTITHYQGISGSFGAKQYAYWCASGVDFTMNSEALFSHESKGMSYLGAAATGNPTNVVTSALAQPDWKFLVGIAGPASGGTQVNSVTEGGIAIARQVKPFWTLDGGQAPFAMVRNSLALTGKFTHVAENESPMLNMLNNVQPQVQMTMTNGLAGANLLACTFDCQVAAYDTAKLTAADAIQYEVTWRAIANATNAGQSAGLSPGKITLQNAIPTY